MLEKRKAYKEKERLARQSNRWRKTQGEANCAKEDLTQLEWTLGAFEFHQPDPSGCDTASLNAYNNTGMEHKANDKNDVLDCWMNKLTSTKETNVPRPNPKQEAPEGAPQFKALLAKAM